MVQKSPGVIFAQSLLGYAVVGFLALMGTSAEVEMEPFGSLPSGWARLAGHFGVRSFASRPRVRVSRDAGMADVVGAAEATASKAEKNVKALMVGKEFLRYLEDGISEERTVEGQQSVEINSCYLYT